MGGAEGQDKIHKITVVRGHSRDFRGLGGILDFYEAFVSFGSFGDFGSMCLFGSLGLLSLLGLFSLLGLLVILV